MMTRTLVSGGINWNWYLCGDFDEAAKTVTILCTDRWHKYDDPKHPVHENVNYHIVEGPGRIASAVVLTLVRDGAWVTEEYAVLNPAQVFSYNDHSKFVMEG